MNMKSACFTPFQPFKTFAPGARIPKNLLFYWGIPATLALPTGAVFARAGTAYYADVDTNQQIALANAARFELDQYLLLESSSTNKVLYSEDGTNWSNLGACTFDTSYTFKGLKAARITSGTANWNRVIYYAGALTGAPAGGLRLSCFIDLTRTTCTLPRITIRNNTLAQDTLVYFNVTTETFSYDDLGPGPISDGTYDAATGRLSVLFKPVSATDVHSIGIGVYDYAGGGYVTVGAFQIELQPTTSSYIKTVGAAVTRAVEALDLSGCTGYAANNETRFTYSDDSTADADDWDGVLALDKKYKKVAVYAPGGRPI